MPSIQSVRALVAPVVVSIEGLTITLNARLHKIHAQEEEYQALVRKDVDLQIRLEQSRQKMQRQLLEAAAPVAPEAPAFVRFRQELERSFEAASTALQLEDADTRESELSQALGSALKLTRDFDAGTQPDARALKKREAEATKKSEATEAEIRTLAGDLQHARARRLVFLLTPPASAGEGEAKDASTPPWDLTDGEAVWEVCEANILSLGTEMADALLEAVEKKVNRGFSPVTLTSIA